MAEIRGGERGQRRRRRRFRPYHRSSDAWRSEGYSISSDTELVGNGRRNSDLEDALFGLFRNKVVESLKRNFTDCCIDSMATNEMECERCGWPYGPCQEKGKVSFFYVYLGEGFLQSMTIPCFMRGMFNKNMIAMSPEKDEYIFDVKKNYVRTLFFGPEYEKMLADFDMKSGDMVRFEWDHLNDAFFAFYPLGPDGVLKGRVLEPHVFEDAAKSVVFSEGLTLTAGQTGRMNHHVLTRGLGLGHVFVHTITVTDVAHNGLRIPKEISSVLNIDEEGKAILIYGYDGANFELSYYTCRDQRICFRGGWQQFAKLHNLDEGVVVLILFHNDNDGRLVLSFDAI